MVLSCVFVSFVCHLPVCMSASLVFLCYLVMKSFTFLSLRFCVFVKNESICAFVLCFCVFSVFEPKLALLVMLQVKDP